MEAAHLHLYVSKLCVPGLVGPQGSPSLQPSGLEQGGAPEVCALGGEDLAPRLGAHLPAPAQRPTGPDGACAPKVGVLGRGHFAPRPDANHGAPAQQPSGDDEGAPKVLVVIPEDLTPKPDANLGARAQQPAGLDEPDAPKVGVISPGAAMERPASPAEVLLPAATPPPPETGVHWESQGTLRSVESRHPLQRHGKLVSSISLVRLEDFEDLAVPLPRCQDLPPHVRCSAEAGDIVASVSHAWLRQAHPDPLGAKRDTIVRLLRGTPCKLFFDFTGIPQRPFAPDQAPRTPEEAQAFEAALRCMYEMYFYSDRIVHILESGEPGTDVLKQEAACLAVSADELAAAELSQIGDWVQVTGLRVGDAGAEGACRLFDRVASVAGAAVTSLAELRAGLQSADAKVTLERWPYGRVNGIPADQRGWVFLERFITMVKCAMLDAEEAREVVLTDSEAIRAQIMAGAGRLREAARHLRAADGSAGSDRELRRVLESFVAELAVKHFSPASTDKRLIDDAARAARGAEPPPDAEVVKGIMERFVARLATKWLEEEGKQRQRASGLRLLRTAAVSYMTTWNSLSQGYAERLEAGGSCWKLLALLLVPPMLVLVLALQPFPRPDTGPGSQWAFWIHGASLVPLFCLPFFPQWFKTMLKLQGGWRLELKRIGWLLVTGGLVSGTVPVVAFATGMFPVPLHLLMTALILALTLPLLLALVPGVPWRRRLWGPAGAAWCIVTVALVVFGEGFPLLIAVLRNAEPGWQVLVTPVFLITKLAVEFVQQRLCRFLSPDVLPNATWFAAAAYERLFCTALASGNNWLVTAELLAFDALENLFHLLSIRRIIRQRSGSPEDAHRQCVGIAVALLLRELSQVFVPTCFLLEIYLIRRIQPRYSNIVCGIAEDEFRQILEMLALDIASQLAIAAGSCAVVRRMGLPPLRLLSGIVESTFPLNLLAATTSSVYYMAMEHSHFGMDLTFHFSWAGKGAVHSVWDCGLQWRAP